MSLTYVTPELTLSAGGLVLLMVAGFAGRQAATIANWLAIALLAVVFGILWQWSILSDGAVAFAGLYRVDAFGVYAKLLILGSAIASLLVAPRFFTATGGEYRAEYPLLIVFASIGMSMMVSAFDLMTLYVGLELNSLAAYVLASFMRKDSRSAEAGLKYFVLGALASGILLYGISLLYGFSGTTSFVGIGSAISSQIETQGHLGGGLAFGLVFVLTGLAFKISAAPLHMWTPDVYEGAPTPVTAFFASAPKVAAIALLTRITITALGPIQSWQPIIIFAALLSISWGALAAPMQTNIKRLLAYSSINNVGFALIGLAAGTPEGIAGLLSYMFIYVIMTIGSFLCVLQMRDENGQPIEEISALSGLSQRRKGLAAAFAIFMFSLAGIPPLFGFWAKFLVFDAAVRAGLVPLAALGIAASVIGAFYYLKIIKTMYFDEPAERSFGETRSAVEYGVLTVCAAVVVLGYLLNPWLDAVSGAAAKALF